MAIFGAALRLRADEREAYIQSACGTDGELFQEVMGMIRGEEKMGGFLKSPIPMLSEFARPFQIGETVAGRFEIIRELGEGGMGVVYEAFDHRRNQRIAIKAAKFGVRRALTPEMESALRVRHRNVCLVNEIHTAATPRGEVDFLTMELLEGETLAAHLAKMGKLPLAKAVEIAQQLCAGLAEAHQAGVIHKDLKPSNVMLCRDAMGRLRVVIMDFGLAGEGGEPEGLWGAPRYIAPELWMGTKASQASDLYALGVMLFEMVEGRVPAAAAARGAQRKGLAPGEPYWQLTQGLLDLDLEKRQRAFDKTARSGYWKGRGWTRRAAFAVAASGVCALASGAWFERTEVENLLDPLPAKRHVALLAWPRTPDVHVDPLVSAAIDAIGHQLARAEAFDHELVVLPPEPSANVEGAESEQVRAASESRGANLALELSGHSTAEEFRLEMKLIDAKTLRAVRRGSIACGLNDIALLDSKAVDAASALLNVRSDTNRLVPIKPPTRIPEALTLFRAAEELMKKPNDEGMDEAIDKYRKAIEADSDFALAYARLATAYIRKNVISPNAGALPLAEANAQKAVQLDSLLPDGHTSLGAVWVARGREDQAAEEYRKALALDPDNPFILLRQGQMYAKFNHVKEARETFKHLKEVRPNYWLVYNEFGVLLSTQGEYVEAIEEFRAATLLAPLRAEAFSNLGAMFLKVGRFAEARDQFETSLRLKPMGDVYANLSISLLSLGKYPEAAKFSRRALDLNSGNDLYWMCFADSYDAMKLEGQARESYQRAATETERLLDRGGPDGAALRRLALYKAKLGKPEEALELLRKADDLKVSDIESKLVKARVLELLGRRNDALTTIADCLGHGGTRYDVELTPDLGKLQNDPEYERIRDASAKERAK
jgi:tetratricopeptide (TPR) repeat protein